MAAAFSTLRGLWAEFRPMLWDIAPRMTRATLKQDVISGLTVAIVAIPMSLAFAIASGVGPERGLFAVIVGGFLISLLGGSRHQIGGPTGAFVAVLFLIMLKHGYNGMVVATIMAGFMLIVLGFARLGAFIKYIPYPVVAGFTTGIACIILTTQLQSFFGLQLSKVPGDFVGRVWACLQAAWQHGVNPWAVGLGVATVVLLLLVRRLKPQIPAAIVAVAVTTAVAVLCKLPVETITSHFGALPHTLPPPAWPHATWAEVQNLFPDAMTIALLAAMQGLLSAIIADGISGDKHKSNTELIGQGIANIASVIFGGIAVTGGVARTATNVRSGGFSPVSGMVHALFILLFILVASPLAGPIPLATLAGVLFVVCYDMADVHMFRRLLHAPAGDVVVLLLTFGLTLINITIAVQVGVMMAALLFMRRMADVTAVTHQTQDHLLDAGELDWAGDDDKTRHEVVPPGVSIYRIDGPFFFGAADKMAAIMPRVENPPRVLILRLKNVPVIDATAIHMLTQLLDKCAKQGIRIILACAQPLVQQNLSRMGLAQRIGVDNMQPTLAKAITRAQALL